MDTKLDLLKQLLGIDTLDTSQDAILSHYLNSATTKIANYLNRDISELDTTLDSSIVEFAEYLYKNKDNTGISKKVQGHRSVTMESGIPESIKMGLPLPRIRIVGGV